MRKNKYLKTNERATITLHYCSMFSNLIVNGESDEEVFGAWIVIIWKIRPYKISNVNIYIFLINNVNALKITHFFLVSTI